MYFDEIKDSMQRPGYSHPIGARRAIVFAPGRRRPLIFFLLFLLTVAALTDGQAGPVTDVLSGADRQEETISKPFPDGRTLQEVLEGLDGALKRPDGLYRGTLTLLRRDEPTVVQEFQLIVRSPQAYMTIRSYRRLEELRILWMGRGMELWIYDVPRRQLLRPEAGQRFDPLNAMGFSAVDFFYPWFSGNLKPVRWYVDSLRPDWRMIDCRLIDTDEPQLSIGIDSAGRPARVEVKNRRGILLRVLEFGQGRPLLEWRTDRQYRPSFPTLYEMLDVRRGTVARFETRIYDPGFRPDPSLFDPDFLSR